jgi:hypothetical protein
VLFLDADDVLRPEALRTLVAAYADGDSSYVYPACLAMRSTGRVADAATCDVSTLQTYTDDDPPALSIAPVPEYDQDLWLKMGQSPDLRFGHSVVALIETAAARAVGGFDEAMPALEDQEFYLRLAAAGYCGQRVAAPLFVYRLATGQRRASTVDQRPALMKAIAKKYKPIVEGKVAKKSCCAGVMALRERAAGILADADAPPEVIVPAEATRVRVKYVGPLQGEHTVTGRPSNTAYRVGDNPFNKFANVDPRDLPHLMSLATEWGGPMFEVVR